MCFFTVLMGFHCLLFVPALQELVRVRLVALVGLCVRIHIHLNSMKYTIGLESFMGWGVCFFVGFYGFHCMLFGLALQDPVLAWLVALVQLFIKKL